MKKTNELSFSQMKEVKGGKRLPQAYGHCYIDGEIIFECMCTNDRQCQSIYGSGAECY